MGGKKSSIKYLGENVFFLLPIAVTTAAAILVLFHLYPRLSIIGFVTALISGLFVFVVFWSIFTARRFIKTKWFGRREKEKSAGNEADREDK